MLTHKCLKKVQYRFLIQISPHYRVLPGDRIVLLGCPMLFREGPDEDASITGILSDHIRDSIEHVDEYMGIDLRIASIRVLPCLTALAHKD